jgi:hypothetical protein
VPLCNESYSLREGEVFDLHYKLEDIPTQIAAEAHEYLLILVYVKGRGFFIVKGASGYMISPALFERHVFGDYRHDIGGVPHFIQNTVRIERHNKQSLFFSD